MEENGNLFLVLDLLRSELQPLGPDGEQPEKLEGVLGDIGKAVRGLAYGAGEVHAAALLETASEGIRYAEKLMRESRYADSALTAKMALINLLANRHLFR